MILKHGFNEIKFITIYILVFTNKNSSSDGARYVVYLTPKDLLKPSNFKQP